MADNYLERQFEKLLPKVIDPETGYARKVKTGKKKRRN